MSSTTKLNQIMQSKLNLQPNLPELSDNDKI